MENPELDWACVIRNCSGHILDVNSALKCMHIDIYDRNVIDVTQQLFID